MLEAVKQAVTRIEVVPKEVFHPALRQAMDAAQKDLERIEREIEEHKSGYATTGKKRFKVRLEGASKEYERLKKQYSDELKQLVRKHGLFDPMKSMPTGDLWSAPGFKVGGLASHPWYQTFFDFKEGCFKAVPVRKTRIALSAARRQFNNVLAGIIESEKKVLVIPKEHINPRVYRGMVVQSRVERFKKFLFGFPFFGQEPPEVVECIGECGGIVREELRGKEEYANLPTDYDSAEEFFDKHQVLIALRDGKVAGGMKHVRKGDLLCVPKPVMQGFFAHPTTQTILGGLLKLKSKLGRVKKIME